MILSDDQLNKCTSLLSIILSDDQLNKCTLFQIAAEDLQTPQFLFPAQYSLPDWGLLSSIRASLLVLSMWLQTVQFIAKKSKCASLAQEIGFSAPNLCRVPWLVKGATQLCTSEKENNKLDLTAAQYFWLVDHNYWSRWFAISSPHVYAVPVKVLLVGLPKTKQLNLDI